jgi:hypothetical protein
MCSSLRVLLVWSCLVSAASSAGPPSQSAHDPRHGGRSEWEIVFEDEISLEEYARQLEYFKIEIAATSRDGKVEYIGDLLKRKPEKRVGRVESDYRVHIGWRKGNLYAADRRLLSKAGIASEGKELRHYLPTAVEAQLVTLERNYADRRPDEIRRTRFALRPKPKRDGYEFFVVEQNPPRAAASRKSPSENQPRENAAR